MWKAVLAGTTALALAGTSMVYAQQRPGRDGRDGGRHGPASIEDMRAFSDARLAALRAGLELTPDQEKNWPAFEQAAKDLAKLRLDRVTALRERRAARQQARRNGGQQQNGTQQNGAQQQTEQQQQTTAGPIDRMRQRGTAMAETGSALKKLADATEPLYNSLDDKQKRRFAVLGRLGGPRAGHHGGWRGMRRDHRRSELMPGQFDRDGRFRTEGRGPQREGFGHGPRRGADHGTENL